MAYRGTRGATTAAGVERDEHLQPQTPADLVAMSRGGGKPATAAHLLKERSTRGGSIHHERGLAAATVAAAPPAVPAPVDDLLRRVIALDIVDDDTSSSEANSPIETIPQLKQEMEGMCRTISATLGRQQKESAYQLALELELQLRGVTVQREAKISVTYRGRDISSRRVDLLLNVGDGSTAIVEMKAVQTITKGTNLGAVHQLQYYLDVFDVDHGFLVNFPHDSGFPPPPNGGVFRQEPICGVKGPLSDVRVRERKGGGVGEGPEVVYFQRVSA